MAEALPSTNLNLMMIRNAVGYTANDLAGMTLHSGVNRWGFFTPDPAEWNRFFGVNPTSPYPMGLFRGYLHDWRCFACEDIDNATTFLSNVFIDFNIRWFPAWSINRNYLHTFTVYFARQANYADKVVVPNYNVAQFGSSFRIVVSKDTPPDGGDPLVSGTTYYLRIFKTPAYIGNDWDDRQSSTPSTNHDATGLWWDLPFTIPVNPFPMTIGFGTNEAYAWNTGTERGVSATVQVVNNTYAEQTVTMEVQWRKSDDVTVINTQSVQVVVPAGTYDGTTVTAGLNSGAVSGNMTADNTVGQTVKVYARFTQLLSGISLPTSFVFLRDITVQNTLPA